MTLADLTQRNFKLICLPTVKPMHCSGEFPALPAAGVMKQLFKWGMCHKGLGGRGYRERETAACWPLDLVKRKPSCFIQYSWE